MKSPKERLAEYRRFKAEKGFSALNVWIDEPAKKVLEREREETRRSKGEIVSIALKRYGASQEKVRTHGEEIKALRDELTALSEKVDKMAGEGGGAARTATRKAKAPKQDKVDADAAMQRIGALKSESKSNAEIARVLNEAGITTSTGREWTGGNVARFYARRKTD